MARQEEIREGLKTVVGNAYIYCPYDLNGITRNILSYLHSQGVVLKKEGELPDLYHTGTYECEGRKFEVNIKKDLEQVQQDMLKAGFVAVEPLIEEKK